MIFGSVARYTRFVRSTKLMLALFAVVLTCAILFYPLIHKESKVRIAFTSISKKTPGGPTEMANPQFHGLDKSYQPFNVTAKTATQEDENTVTLDHPIGDISLKSGAWLSVLANSGIFKVKEKDLDLTGSVEMFTDAGYEFRMEHMHANVGDKTAFTHDEVRGQGIPGTLIAKGGAQVDSAGERVLFNGPVFVTIYPSQNDDKKKETKEEQ